MADVPELFGLTDEDAAAPPSEPTVLADQMAQARDRQRQQFVYGMEMATKVNPDEFARATKVEKLTGVSADVVRKYGERLDQLLEGNRYASMFDRHRKTADALRDGRTATLAQDDIDNLVRVEQAAEVTRFQEQGPGQALFNAMKQAFYAGDQGSRLEFADSLQRQSRQFDRIDAEIARAAEAGEEPFADGNAPIGFGQDYLRADEAGRAAMRENLVGVQSRAIEKAAGRQDDLDQIPTEPGLIRSQELGGGFGGMGEAIAENPGLALRATAGALVSSAEMLAAGIFGGPLAAAPVGFNAEYTAKMGDVLKASGIDVKDPKAVLAALQDDELMAEARRKAALKAAGTTAVDVLSMGLAGRLIAPASVAGKPLTALQREGLSLAAQVPVQGVLEGAGEAAGQYLAEGEVDTGQVLLEAVAGGGMSSVEVMAFGGGRVWESISEGLQKSKVARQSVAALDEMSDSAVNSKLRERDPETYQNLTAEQLKNSDVEQIWIPSEALEKLNQSGVPLADLMAAVPGLNEQYQEAQARGGSVTMKTSEYLTYFAEYQEQLSGSIRMQVDGLSMEDAAAWQEAQAQQIDDLAASYAREPDERDQAMMTMVGELVSAGYRRADAEQYAQLNASAMSTLAERTGKPISELLARFPLTVRNESPEQLRSVPVDDMRLAVQRLRAGDIPQSRDMFGKSLAEYLRDSGGLNDQGGELAALDADVGKVGRNRLVKKDGRSLDDAAMAAWENGYFPGVAREDVTPQLIIDAIRDDMNDQPRFSVEQENATLRDQAGFLNQLSDYLGKLGVDLATMTDDEVLAVLRRPDAITGTQLEQADTELNRALDMTEDEYIAAINPTGKETESDDIVLVTLGDLSLPQDAENIGTVEDRAGGQIDLYSDADGAIYAFEDGQVIGQIDNQEGETLSIVVQEAQGRGIGTALAAALIRRDPFAQAGSFSPAGEAARRSAFRQLKEERGRTLNQSGSGITAVGSTPYAEGVKQAEDQFSSFGNYDYREGGVYRGAERLGSLKLRVDGNRLVIDDIEMKNKGQGSGTAVIQSLSESADRQGLFVSLTSDAMRGKGQQKRLRAYYQRIGFLKNAGTDRVKGVEEEFYLPPSARLEQASDDGDARGSISFNQGDARRFQITLGEKRDLSTLLHEFGHYYLEVMTDLSSDADAPAQIRDDNAAIRKWVGAEDGKPYTVEQHEQFARGFERYLAEGKAPSPELAGAFARFKRWITAIYKDLRRLNVELDDDIRGVFDRIVATDEQISDAEAIVQAIPMFESAAKAGMSEAEFANYQAQVQAAADEARTDVEQQVIREEERRRSKWWREESERIKAEVEEEFDLVPEYATMKALRTGQMADGTETRVKLDSAELRERYGVQAMRKMIMMHSKGGIPLDLAAYGFGYDSGDQMVKAILGTPSRAAAVRQEVETRMLERHGTKSTGEAAERAMDAVHNEKRGAVLVKELEALGKRGNRNNITSQEVLRQAAARIMQQRRVRDIQPYEYQRSEAKAGRAAFLAAAKGDLERAYEAKQEQLLNFNLWREATKARKQIDEMVDRLAKNNTTKRREKLGKAGHDYLDQVDAVMEQYEFRNVSLRQLDRTKSFGQWYAEQVEQGNDPVVPEFVLNTAGRVNYKDLSLEQLSELDEFVANINHLAGIKNKLLANKHIKDLKEAREALAAGAFANMEKRPTRHIVANARSLPEVAGDWLKKGNSSLLKMEQVIEWLDGGDASGPWSTVFFEPLAEAQHQRDDLNREYSQKVVELTQKWMAERGSSVGQLFQVRGLAKPMTTNGMLAVALNTGNLGNRTKLLDGYGWDETILQGVLAHMTEADWQYVARMWSTVEELWPHIERLEKQVNGVAPPKVEPLKVQTPFGEFEGGYWPLVYDPLSTKYADVQKSMGSLAPLSENGSVRATPARGHTKARVDGFAAPILLDVSVIGNHLGQVIHDLTHRVALRDAHSLLRGEAREALAQTIGPEMTAQFSNMLDGIASDQNSGDSRAIGTFAGVMNALRTNQSVAWMGYSITTILNQLGGYPQALDYFAQKGGRKFLYRAMLKFWADPIQNLATIQEMSGEMRNRAVNLDASIREAQQKVLRMKDGRVVQDAFKGMLNARDVMVKYAFVPMQTVQSMIDGVVWSGAYEMAGGVLDHDAAVQAADRAVRLTQTAGGAKDMATIQQNTMAKLFMPVYGYASLLWNRNVDIARSAGQAVKARDAQQVLVAFERFVYLNILPAVLAAMIKGALPDDEDDEETWSGWLAIQSLLGIASGIPLMGAVAQGFFGDFGYAGASSIGQGFDSLIRSTNANREETITTSAISAFGAFTGFPASQVNRGVRTMFMVEDGEMDDSALAITRGLLFGPPKKD